MLCINTKAQKRGCDAVYLPYWVPDVGALLRPQPIHNYRNVIRVMFEHAKDVVVTGGSITEIHGDSHTYGKFQLVCHSPCAMLTPISM